MGFEEMRQIRKMAEEQGRIKYKQESKSRLSRIATKKITTTMIGALAIIETHFGFLWNNDDVKTEDQIRMRELYERVREEILDNGNNQIRNIKAELDQYDVEWLRYRITLPVRKMGEKDGQE